MGTFITSGKEVADLKKSHGSEALELIEIAIAVGWKVMRNGINSITLISPNEVKRIHLSSKHQGRGNVAQMGRTILRYGDARLVDNLHAVATDGSSRDEFSRAVDEQATIMAAAQDAQIALDAMKVVVPESRGSFGQTTQEQEKPVEAPVEKKPERYIVTERPALMHYSRSAKGGGKSYHSKTAIERTWSDGAVDYRCAISTCDGVSDNHRAFSGAHWGMHVRKGEAAIHNEMDRRSSLVDDPNYTEAAHTRTVGPSSRMSAIARFIKGIDVSRLSAEELARLLQQQFSPQPVDDEAERTPMTPEQILDRIRSMVDNGKYVEQEARIAELSAELAASKAAHQATKDSVKVLRDLIDEEMNDD